MANYEMEMRGMHKKGDFNNATGTMRGEHGKHVKEPGGMESGPHKERQHYAMGGVGKIRHGVATKSGAPRHMMHKDLQHK